MARHVAWPTQCVAAALLFLAPDSFASAQTLQFGTHKDYSTGYGPGSMAVGDVNGDGRVDLAVADAFSDQVAVLFGNGDGTFTPPLWIYLGPSNNPRSIAIADLNRDGKADLVVANAAANTVAVIFGNGTGTFQPAVTIAAPGTPVSLAVADFNGDGNPDLVLANSAASTLSVLLGNGDGTFQAARTFTADAGPA